MKTSHRLFTVFSIITILVTVTLSCDFPLNFTPKNSSFDDAALMMIASRSMLDLYTPLNEPAARSPRNQMEYFSMISLAQGDSKQQLNEQLALEAEFRRLADAAKDKDNQFLVDFYTAKADEHKILADQLEKKRADWRRNRRFFYVIKRGARAFGHAIGNIIEFAAQAAFANIQNQIDFYVDQIRSFLANPIRYTFDLSIQRQLQIIQNQLTNRLGPFFGQRAYDLINIDQAAWNIERQIFVRKPKTTPTKGQTPTVKATEAAAEDNFSPPETGEGEVTVIGNWHGAACDEAEGTYQYRWSVDLIQDPDTSQFVGTIKFHACPGGGRVLYRVLGDPTTDPSATLKGIKKEGGGDLFANSPDTATFTVDLNNGDLSPNYSK